MTIAPQSEAVILAGGASRRMGVDKAGILIDGQPSIDRILRVFERLGWRATILGGEPIPGADYQADLQPHLGPLPNLRGFMPRTERVFVASCDLLLFDETIPLALSNAMGTFQAAIPQIEGFLQPLCALYRAGAFEVLRSLPELTRVRDWTERLDAMILDEEALHKLGVDPWHVRGANTPEQAQELLNRKSTP